MWGLEFVFITVLARRGIKFKLGLFPVAFGLTVAVGRVESHMAAKYTVMLLINRRGVKAGKDTTPAVLWSGTIPQWNGGLVLAE